MPMSSQKVAEHTVDLIYDAALQPTLWRDVLMRLADTTHCEGGAFFLHGQATGTGRLLAEFGHDPTYLESLVEHYLPMAPDFQVAPRLPVGIVTTNSALIPPDVFEKSLFYNEWARPQHIADAVIAAVHRSDAGFANLYVVRSDQAGYAGRDDAKRIAHFVPHITRALRLAFQLDVLSLRDSELASVLSRLAMAIFLIDGAGRILCSNEAAEDLMRTASGLRVVNQRLRAADPKTQTKLQGVIARAVSGQDSTRRAGDVAVPRAGRPLVLSVVPLSPQGGDLLAQQERAAAIVIAMAHERRAGALDGIAAAYGLTAAETRLLAAIVDGKSVETAAERLRISRATARTHLQHIFAKTYTSRQAELIRLVVNTVPPLRSHRP